MILYRLLFSLLSVKTKGKATSGKVRSGFPPGSCVKTVNFRKSAKRFSARKLRQNCQLQEKCEAVFRPEVASKLSTSGKVRSGFPLGSCVKTVNFRKSAKRFSARKLRRNCQLQEKCEAVFRPDVALNCQLEEMCEAGKR